ncbi:unnamed protein product [Brassica oleracea]
MTNSESLGSETAKKKQKPSEPDLKAKFPGLCLGMKERWREITTDRNLGIHQNHFVKSRRRCCSAATSSSESVHEITPKQFPPPRHVEKKDKGSIEEESEESEDEWVEVDSDEDLEDMDEDDDEEGSGKDMNEDDDIEFELDQT